MGRLLACPFYFSLEAAVLSGGRAHGEYQFSARVEQSVGDIRLCQLFAVEGYFAYINIVL